MVMVPFSRTVVSGSKQGIFLCFNIINIQQSRRCRGSPLISIVLINIYSTLEAVMVVRFFPLLHKSNKKWSSFFLKANKAGVAVDFPMLQYYSYYEGGTYQYSSY